MVVDVKEYDFHVPVEKFLVRDEHLFVGTVNELHRLSSSTLNKTLHPMKVGPNLDNPLCRQVGQCSNLIPTNYHWKVLLMTSDKSLLLCGTLFQGACQLVDENFQRIVNSSLPVVANDPVNSSIALIIHEENLVYFGVTYTNRGVLRWQIPSIAGRSLNRSDFMKIPSNNDANEFISRDDLSVRFMPRQQANFVVQYVYTFQTSNYIYFVSNQPNDLDERSRTTKLIRFCRENSNRLLRSYSEIPLVCVNDDWTLKSARTLIDHQNEEILIGHFERRDGSKGTNVCSWNIRKEIDRAFLENYQTCYSFGDRQRGLAFIKPNEPCRKDEVSHCEQERSVYFRRRFIGLFQSWFVPSVDENICPWIVNDRLPYPVGGRTALIGRLIYENSSETSNVFEWFRFSGKIFVVQGLMYGSLKLVSVSID